MPLFAENEQKIFGDVLYDVVNNTVITKTSPGSKMRALTQATSKKLGDMYKKFDLNMSQAFLNGARGKYLNFIGTMLNVPRLGEERASISSVDKIIKFYVDVGTFGSINGGSSINIPAGTIIRTSSDGSGVSYKTPVSAILPADSSSMYVAAEAVNAGPAGNVGKNTLVYHSFSNYSDYLNNSLKVTNESEIANGQNPETDINYRFRIANQILTAEAANSTAIRLAALNVPGVSDIVQLPYARGIGTFDILVQSITPKPSANLLSAVTAAVYRATAYGELGNVRAPTDIGMALTGRIALRRKATAAEQTNIINTVTQNITDYINNLDIGEEFIVNEAIERVMSTSDLIKDIGTPSVPFESIYTYTPSRVEDNKVRSTLIGNYAPEADAKITVELEYAGSTPILFTVN